MKTYFLKYVNKFWELKERGVKIAQVKWKRKGEAVAACREMFRATATKEIPISFKICKRNGEFENEHTYQRSSDPRKSKG